jgi:hypothetical protein
MAHLLHIDSSVQGDLSVSRRLAARAAERWRATHPGGTVAYRDFAVDPIPHLDAATGTARLVQPDQRTPAQHSCAESVCPAPVLAASVNAHRGSSVRSRVLCASNSSTSVHRYSTLWPTFMNVGLVPR